MKANEDDYKKYSEAIDKMEEGNDSMIDLFIMNINSISPNNIRHQ